MKYAILKNEERKMVYPYVSKDVEALIEANKNYFAVLAVDELEDEVVAFAVVDIDEVSTIIDINALEEYEGTRVIEDLIAKICDTAGRAGSKVMLANSFGSENDVNFIRALNSNQFVVDEEIVERVFYLDDIRGNKKIARYKDNSDRIILMKDAKKTELMEYARKLKEEEGYRSLLDPTIDRNISYVYLNSDESIGGGIFLSQGEDTLRVEYWNTSHIKDNNNYAGVQLIAKALAGVSRKYEENYSIYVQLINLEAGRIFDLLGIKFEEEDIITTYYKVLS